MAKLVIRIDDVHERMNWQNFEFFTEMLLNCGMTAILGIVPQCEDRKLIVSDTERSFWQRIEFLAMNGFKISQHGFRHLYDSSGDTVLKGNTRSEFAGLSFEDQFNRLSRGKKLLEQRGFSIDTFMAPGHSFDLNTLHCLRELGFKNVTDGYGIWPYHSHGLKFVPQLFSVPHGLNFGVYTTCFHLDSLDRTQIKLIFDSLSRHQVISFDEAANIEPPLESISNLSQHLTRVLIKGFRGLRGVSLNNEL